MSDEIKFKDMVKQIDNILQKLQSCEDVDDALDLFEKGSMLIQTCERRVESAKGKFEEILNTCNTNNAISK